MKHLFCLYIFSPKTRNHCDNVFDSLGCTFLVWRWRKLKHIKFKWRKSVVTYAYYVHSFVLSEIAWCKSFQKKYTCGESCKGPRISAANFQAGLWKLLTSFQEFIRRFVCLWCWTGVTVLQIFIKIYLLYIMHNISWGNKMHIYR